jgi:phosphoserine phosphatase
LDSPKLLASAHAASEETLDRVSVASHGKSGEYSKIKLIAFDLDGTLVRDRSSWRKVHEFFGTEAYGDEDLRKYERGEISYLQFMENDISRWPKGIKRSTIEKILSRCSIAKGARRLFSRLRERGIKTLIISSGLEPIASKVALVLKPDIWLANDLEVDEQGFLTGRGILRVEPRRKGEVLSEVMRKLGLQREDVMAVGDTRFDVGFLSVAGVSVALNPPTEDLETICKVVNFIISDLGDIEGILSILG